MLAGAELLIDEPLARRGRRMLEALREALPAGSVVTEQYQGKHSLLVLYGVGLAARMQIRADHLSAGGRVAMWDLGYWDRDEAMRLTIDSFHPTPAQIAASPAVSRGRSFDLREDANSEGPILLAGMGHKSAAMLGLQELEWERAKVKVISQRFPGRLVLWRPKGRVFEPLRGTGSAHGVPIETALRGASLLVCRHSNVAIDACLAGVPVECEDGAARALYLGCPAPTREQRAAFLNRLTYWNWRPSEAAEAWKWMNKMTDSKNVERIAA